MNEESGTVPLRIGDAERDEAVTSLQEHHVAGRLDRDEFDSRMAAALAARTRADLEPLFVDLPRPAAPAVATAAVVTTPRPVPVPWQRYGVPAVASAIWPMAIFACIVWQNWSLIGVAVVLSMMLGGGWGGGARRAHLQRVQGPHR